ncbi:LOW QUALITY PROTEIN: small VCP/p97-interacting protein [Elephas maximus indicus]|uniref:LOW QUALITY PROTEIN: small VCP/p97-interacting protein n=1 Tax=Elephas maximus indicus TaxID=99487 RepID=UPI0021172AB0|nr:LOW QUALITY PROTEIN: small VCP/p97-interacting protein [Elephas maximus indicus]
MRFMGLGCKRNSFLRDEVFNVLGNEEKRAKLAEAAERRQKEAASRGILDVQSVEEKRRKREKIEKQIASSGPPPEGGLRWTVS